MTKKQQKILDDAAKTTLKNEGILGGGSKYVNPIHKRKPKEKPKSFWDKLFS